MYLGRFGALGRFTYELAEAAQEASDLDLRFMVSSNNEDAEVLKSAVPGLLTLPTFHKPTPQALLLGYFRARRELAAILDRVRPAAVVNLMPHVWSPLLAATVKRRGCRFISVIHDAVPHPGDNTAYLTRWLLRDAHAADRIVTLSDAVTSTLLAQGRFAPGRIDTLFHPDLRFASNGAVRTRREGAPLRVLFFGRIMAYKGLEVYAEAIAKLRDAGFAVEPGVAGSGRIPSETRELLHRLGAEVENSWIPNEKITSILDRYDSVVCAHLEASQSGVAATAFGHAMPVVALPTGGIVEQVKDRETGILATRVTPSALADAIAQLANTPGLYDSISRNLASTAPRRSMNHFLDRIAGVALAGA
jgi:glycosyltransferase involved in cell wall biosynthesis